MTTSRQTSFLSNIASEDACLSGGTLAFLGQRLRNNLYDFVLTKFLERESEGFTRADLARRINYDPARISRLLGAPGNWTMETVSTLLAGIAAEELVLSSKSLLAQPRNFRGEEWLDMIEMEINTSVELSDDNAGKTPVGSGAPNPQPTTEPKFNWARDEREDEREYA